MGSGYASHEIRPAAVSTPRSVFDIVSRFSQLKQLTDRANRLRDLNQSLLSCVPVPLVEHVRLATIRDGCLVLQAQGSAWAAQLRFKTPEILEKLQAHPEFGEVRSVRVRNVVEPNPKVVPRERRHMSQITAEVLRNEARCTVDVKIRAALERLARHASD